MNGDRTLLWCHTMSRVRVKVIKWASKGNLCYSASRQWQDEILWLMTATNFQQPSVTRNGNENVSFLPLPLLPDCGQMTGWKLQNVTPSNIQYTDKGILNKTTHWRHHRVFFTYFEFCEIVVWSQNKYYSKLQVFQLIKFLFLIGKSLRRS